VRLAKEDSMDDDGPILIANSHGDNILCNIYIGVFGNCNFICIGENPRIL